MYQEQRRPESPTRPPSTPGTPTPVTPKSYPFLQNVTSPMSGCMSIISGLEPTLISLVHTILGKKANRSSSLSQVVNYFDSSPSMSDNSTSLLDSPLRRPDNTPKQHSSFYNPREPSDTESDSDDDESLRDQSPELAEADNRGLRSRNRGFKGYIAPRRWPNRLKGSHSSGSSEMGTGGSNSTTSLTGQSESMGRQNSPEFIPSIITRGSISDIGSDDLPLRKLSVSRNESYEFRAMSPFVLRLKVFSD